ncbi:hypothetical protein AXF42_Ash012892 [Apostasia shenzhenica]|uniref:CUE domain-containing protein n=1 Tax=Apostasia shenzhenica TaxID=1088818 RepID=A0A2I0ARI5_9ASPA|nr:hypothetical protein AXF42_Ash012892 [Apostasia shenzhenica]
MASSSPQQRSRGLKESFRRQMRYAPKADNSSSGPSSAADAAVTVTTLTTGQPPSLTTSLRSGDLAKHSTAEKGREGLSVSSGGSFVRYLPQDEAVASGLGADAGGLDAVESQAVVDFLNEELSRLLKMKPRDFWGEVAKSDSLHEFLDSYVQFRSRWYDFPHRCARGMVAGIIVGEGDLCRRVFLILFRISSNRDPGASASDCLSIKDHTALLQEKKLLNLPKLLDICAIYGHENGELTKSLVTNAIKAQPKLLDHLGGAVSHFLSIVRTMHERCSTSLEVLVSSGGHESTGNGQLYNDFLDVMDFINDGVMTFDAFADAYRPAALYFAFSFQTSYGNEELLNSLAGLHDLLIPSMLRGFSLLSNFRDSSGAIPDIILSLKMLSMRTVKLGWKLLDYCYLNDELTEDNLLQRATKMFPASVEDPSVRGDVILQTMKEINGEAPHQLIEHHDFGTFVENIEKNYMLLSRIESLCSQGWILLDEGQFKYLSRIAKSSSLVSSACEPGLPFSDGKEVQVDEDAVLLDSKISQIKDLFPEYGNGFLMACLEVYNQDAEEVIQRILEGTLHEDLLSLDTSLDRIPPSSQTTHNVNTNDKGKTVLVDSASQNNLMPSHLNINLPGGDVGGSSASILSSYGRYTRKPANEVPDTEVLDSKSAKDVIRSAVLAAEFEYEDEYDDSFDELGLSIVESGFEETENLSDRLNSLPGKSADDDQSSSSRWSSQKKPQFYVKDGKNYSYKVSGSVAVCNAKEAAIVNQTQKELIHGLGRGGNLPLGAVQKLENSANQVIESSVHAENLGRGTSSFRGRGGRRGGGNHHRKDRASKKHFSGLSGY